MPVEGTHPDTFAVSIEPVLVVPVMVGGGDDEKGCRTVNGNEVREVLEDPEAMERMREISGQSLTPTMEVDGKVLADFDTGQLSEFLEANGIKP
jgi:hypothetical protein